MTEGREDSAEKNEAESKITGNFYKVCTDSGEIAYMPGKLPRGYEEPESVEDCLNKILIGRPYFSPVENQIGKGFVDVAIKILFGLG